MPDTVGHQTSSVHELVDHGAWGAMGLEWAYAQAAKYDAELVELRSEVERLRSVVHECPTCGEACKECQCVEANNAYLRSIALKLREGLDDYWASLPENAVVLDQVRSLAALSEMRSSNVADTTPQ